MRLFSNPNEVQAPYVPIFYESLLLGMSLFSKKYSIISQFEGPMAFC